MHGPSITATLRLRLTCPQPRAPIQDEPLPPALARPPAVPSSRVRRAIPAIDKRVGGSAGVSAGEDKKRERERGRKGGRKEGEGECWLGSHLAPMSLALRGLQYPPNYGTARMIGRCMYAAPARLPTLTGILPAAAPSPRLSVNLCYAVLRYAGHQWASLVGRAALDRCIDARARKHLLPGHPRQMGLKAKATSALGICHPASPSPRLAEYHCDRLWTCDQATDMAFGALAARCSVPITLAISGLTIMELRA